MRIRTLVTIALAWALALVTPAAEVGIEVLREGDASEPALRDGDLATVRYSVRLASGEAVPGYADRDAPYVFHLGIDRLLPGWVEGVRGMRPGEERRISVPPALGYDERGSAVVPPGSELIFEVELLSIRGGSAEDWRVTPSGLRILDLVVGDADAPVVEAGDRVTVHYTGWLEDGTRFDSSRERPQPFVFFADRHQVLPGWDEGILGMREGGKRKLVIPPALAYGARGAWSGRIPPDATLTYEIEAVAVEPDGDHGPTWLDPEHRVLTASGLEYVDMIVGTGPSPSAGNRVVVHYSGYLESGERFSTSRDAGKPQTFVVGIGQLIPGWEEALATMKQGGKRRVRIPPALGFGTRSDGSVPRNATLYFDIELLTVLD